MELNQSNIEKEWFEENLKTLLQSLYNPAVLRGSPLGSLIASQRRGDLVTILRDLILIGIEALRPGKNTPHDSRTWRIYTILRRRYVEQIAQETVAKDMGLSVRQLQREEKVSRQLLADHLWMTGNLDARITEIDYLMNSRVSTTQNSQNDIRNREMEWLRDTASYENVNIFMLIQDVVKTVTPILLINHVEVRLPFNTDQMGEEASIPTTLVRQALLTILAELSKTFANTEIILTYSLTPTEFSLRFDVKASRPVEFDKEQFNHQYEDATSLLSICGGTLQASRFIEAGDCCIEMKVPLQRQQLVMVIDDNADSLTLMERYLSGSSYRFCGARESRQVVVLAAEMQPDAIVMDVMMPEQDGWVLLGQLREHPTTRHIPVIICTILAQRDLAAALGAADFLRKPITRQSLLAALDRLLASQSQASG